MRTNVRLEVFSGKKKKKKKKRERGREGKWKNWQTHTHTHKDRRSTGRRQTWSEKSSEEGEGRGRERGGQTITRTHPSTHTRVHTCARVPQPMMMMTMRLVVTPPTQALRNPRGARIGWEPRDSRHSLPSLLTLLCVCGVRVYTRGGGNGYEAAECNAVLVHKWSAMSLRIDWKNIGYETTDNPPTCLHKLNRHMEWLGHITATRSCD